MPLYQFQCDSCQEQFEEFAPSAGIAERKEKCPACGKASRRIFGGRGIIGVVNDSLDNHKKMCVTLQSDRWPKDRFGRPVVYSRSQEREVLRQVARETEGRSVPISPYDH